MKKMYFLLSIFFVLAMATNHILSKDEYEGEWSSENGGVKVFNADYNSAKDLILSKDKQRVAIRRNDSVVVFELHTGKVIYKYRNANKDNEGIKDAYYLLDENLQYLSHGAFFRDGAPLTPKYHNFAPFRIRLIDIANNKVICDTTLQVEQDLDYDRFNTVYVQQYSINHKFYYSFIGKKVRKNDYYTDGVIASFCIDADSLITSQTKYINYYKFPYFVDFFKSNNDSLIVGTYYNDKFVNLVDNPNDYKITDRKIFLKNGGKLATINSKTTTEYYGNNSRVVSSGQYNTPISFTSDDKYFMTIAEDNSEYWFYKVDNVSEIHKIKCYRANIARYLFSTAQVKVFFELYYANRSLYLRPIQYETNTILSNILIGSSFDIKNNLVYLLTDEELLFINGETNRLNIVNYKKIPNESNIDFLANKTDATTNDNVSFVVSYDAPIKNVKIDFGDGSSLSGIEGNFVHQYQKPGKYTVKIEVESKDGKKYTKQKENYINIQQGIILSFECTIETESGTKYLKVRNTSIGSEIPGEIRISSNALSQSKHTNGMDSASIELSPLSIYYVLLRIDDNKNNKSFTKDTIIYYYGQENDFIVKEKLFSKWVNDVVFIGKTADKYRIIYTDTPDFNLNIGEIRKISYYTVDFVGDSEIANPFSTKILANHTTPPIQFADKILIFDNIPYYFNVLCYFDKNNSINRVSLVGASIISGILMKSPNEAFWIIRDSDTKNHYIDVVDLDKQNRTYRVSIDNAYRYFFSYYDKDEGKAYLNLLDTNCILNTCVIDTNDKMTSLNKIAVKPELLSMLNQFNNSAEKISDDYLLIQSLPRFMQNYKGYVILFNKKNGNYITLDSNLCCKKKILSYSNDYFIIVTHDPNGNLVLDVYNMRGLIVKKYTLYERNIDNALIEMGSDKRLSILATSKKSIIYKLVTKPINSSDFSSVDEPLPIHQETLCYPNPAQSTLAINIVFQGQAYIDVINSLGTSFKCKIISNDSSSSLIDVSNLPVGTFFVQDHKNSRLIKFVISK